MILKFLSYFLKIYPVNKYVTDLKQSCRLEREDFNRCCDIHSFQFFLCLIISGTSECHVFVFPKNFGITFSFGCFCFFFFVGWRRFQAAGWLESLVGPIGVSTPPSEREFVSCWRNGLVLCNAINKIHLGSVPKVSYHSCFR